MLKPQHNMSLHLFLALFLFFFTPTNAFDITQILGQTGEFGTFKTHLIQSGLADEINVRRSITVLAIDNVGMSRAIGKPKDVVKELLSMHVILDYLDIPKLSHLTGNTVMVTTLFQASGKGKDQQGFLNITISRQGQVTFSSVAGTSNTAKLVKSLLSEPYNISVLHIDTMIVLPLTEPPDDNTPCPTSSTPSMSPWTRKLGPSPKSPPVIAPVPSPGGSSPETAPSPEISPSKTPGTSPINRSPKMSPPETWPLWPVERSPKSSPATSHSIPHTERTMPPAAANTPAFTEPAYPHLPPNPFPSSGESSAATPPGVACMIAVCFLSFIIINLLPSFHYCLNSFVFF